MFSSIKNKKGSFVILIDLLMIPIFIIIIISLIDASNIFFLNKKLKSSLDLATKSACIYEDRKINPGFPDGKLYIDENKANQNFYEIFFDNFNRTYNTTNITTKPDIYMEVYNSFSKTQFPNNIPNNVLGKHKTFKINVDRPTVFAVAKIDYKSCIGVKIQLIKYSSCQMSNVNK